MAEGEKICVLCGLSCAGQPRTRNERGQYAHQACAKAKQGAAKAAAAPAGPGSVAALSDDDDDLMGALLDDIPAEAPVFDSPDGIRHQTGCPGCGAAVAPGAVVCLGCGYNHKTGKAGKTKVSAGKAAASGIGGLAASAGGAAASGMATLVGALVGSAVGGLIGALIWAGVVIATNYEIGWIAIGVGVLCGIGAVVGSRGEGGMFPATIAVVLTLVSIVGGKYFAHGYLVDQALAEFEAEQTPLGEMSAAELEDWFGVGYADEILETRLADPDITTELRAEYEEMMALGMSLDDYAEDIAKEARDRWAGVGEEERRDMIVQATRDMEDGQEAFRAYLMGDGFADAFGYMDLLFFGIAVMAAFKVGMGGDE